LLQHELVVLVAHELLHLLLRPLKFDHDRPVSNLYGLASVSLPMTAVLERLAPVLLCFIVLAELLSVEGLHVCVAPLLRFLRILEVSLHITHLHVSV